MAEPTREQIAEDYAKALVIIDRLRTSNAELLAIVREVADLGERLLSGELDPRVPPRYVGSYRLGTLIANAKGAIRQATGDPPSADASDPHVTDPGNPSTRDKGSS
jgi:hypothetical protein